MAKGDSDARAIKRILIDSEIGSLAKDMPDLDIEKEYWKIKNKTSELSSTHRKNIIQAHEKIDKLFKERGVKNA